MLLLDGAKATNRASLCPQTQVLESRRVDAGRGREAARWPPPAPLLTVCRSPCRCRRSGCGRYLLGAVLRYQMYSCAPPAASGAGWHNWLPGCSRPPFACSPPRRQGTAQNHESAARAVPFLWGCLILCCSAAAPMSGHHAESYVYSMCVYSALMSTQLGCPVSMNRRYVYSASMSSQLVCLLSMLSVQVNELPSISPPKRNRLSGGRARGAMGACGVGRRGTQAPLPGAGARGRRPPSVC